MRLGQPDGIRAAASQALEHRFDLLGSGLVEVAHGLSARGVEGHRYPSGGTIAPDRNGEWLRRRVTPANFPTSQRLWQNTDPGYRPIDWQLDFKSGYRWRDQLWHRDIRFGELPGPVVEIEAARLIWPLPAPGGAVAGHSARGPDEVATPRG